MNWEVKENLRRDHPDFEGVAEFVQYYCFDSQTVAKEEEASRETSLRLESTVDKKGAKALAENDFAAFTVDELPVHAGVKPPKPPKKEPRAKTDEEKKTAILKARVRLLTDLHLEAANCSAPSNLESHAGRLLSRAACV
jgi:hypothetical protein